MNLSKRIITKRGSRSSRETALEIGVSHTLLQKIEKGYLPRNARTIKKIARWLKMDPGDLLKALNGGPGGV